MVGLLLHAVVHPADIQDRDGGILVLSTMFGLYGSVTARAGAAGSARWRFLGSPLDGTTG